MKRKLHLLKTLLVAVGLCAGANVWAVDVPTPVYFNDFSSTTGLTQVGSGEFIDDADARFGKIYHNNPIKNKTARTNYLKLPADVLTHSGTTNAMTIGFWINMKTASGENFFHTAVFSAYATSTPGSNNDSPMFRCSAKGVMQLNNGDLKWSDFTKEENDDEAKKTSGNTESTVYLDDAQWHYYTVTLSSNKGAIYVDGSLVNSWTLSSDEVIPAFFTSAASNGYPVVCLGGNQSWGWNDWDASFGYDDFVIYDAALSADQIAQIITNKLHYTVNAVDGSNNVLKVLTGANSASNSVSVAYPRYVLDGTTLREAAATGSNYTKSYTLTTSGQTENIAYTNSTVPNVYYYAEGEDVLTDNRTLADQSFSMNKIGFTTNSTTYVKVTTLPAGTWTITARYYCANNTGAHNGYIKVGDAVKWSQEYANNAGGNSEKTSESFTLTQPTAMYVAADGGSATGFDWLYVSGTPSNTIIGQPDCSINYLNAMTDMVALTPGQSYHYMFVNHNMGATAGWAQNWVLPVYASDGTTKRIVVRADNWEDIGWNNNGFSWTTSSGGWADDYLTEMNGAVVDMTINYSAEKVFTMNSTITTSTGRTLTYSYNSTTGGITLTDESIKVALSVSMSWIELLYEGSTGNVTKSISVAGWATYCSPFALDLEHATGLEDAYIVTGGKNGVLNKSSVKGGTVPANTGLLLKGAEGTATIPVVATSTTDVTGNKLVGKTAEYSLAANGGYVLMASPSLGFYKNENKFTVGANTAYLPANFDSTVGAPAFFSLEGNTTGINSVKAAAESTANEYYNLAGQRVAQPTKGLYIVNGKKVIVK